MPSFFPKGSQQIAALWSSWARKCFLAITCTIWLRLEFRGRHSAWFFGAHLLFFHAKGQILETRIRFWIPMSTFWPRDNFLIPRRPPGQNVDLGVPKSDPGLQNPSPGMKKQKMRAEKPCRTPPSKNQTEPYSASYGQKPFWGVPLMSGIWELAGPLGSQGWPSDDLRGKC